MENALIECLKESGPEHAFHEYLYTLALIAITFAGFATLATSLTENRKLTKFHLLLIDNIFILGFAVVISSLLPPLLNFVPFLDKTTGEAWQRASVFAALLPLTFCLTYPSRRSKVSEGKPMLRGTKILLAFYYLIAALLMFNVFVNEPALYVFALTAQQIINVCTFLYGLRLFVPETQSEIKKSHQSPVVDSTV